MFGTGVGRFAMITSSKTQKSLNPHNFFNFHHNTGMLPLNMRMILMRQIQPNKNVSHNKKVAIAAIIMELDKWFKMRFWVILVNLDTL